MTFSDKTLALAAEAEAALKDIFAEIDRISYLGTCRVLDAFREERVSDA